MLPETHNLFFFSKGKKIVVLAIESMYLSKAPRGKAREPKTWLGLLSTQITKNAAKIKLS